MVRLMMRQLGEAEPLVLLVRDAAATSLLPASRVVLGRLAATALDRLQELERQAQRLVEPSEICEGTQVRRWSHMYFGIERSQQYLLGNGGERNANGCGEVAHPWRGTSWQCRCR